MSNRSGRIMVLGAIVLVIAFLSVSISAAASDNKLILLSPHQEGIIREFTRAFQEWYKASTESM